MLKSAEKPVVVLTDYHTTKGIVKKTTLNTTLVNQANRYFITVSIYLTKYNLKIYHVPGYLNTIPDTLLWLPADINAHD